MSAGHGLDVTPERNLNNFGIGFFAFVALFMGAWTVYLVFLYWKASQSEQWPRVTARMTEWEIDVQKWTKGDRYYVRCSYNYRVGDTVYVGKRLRLSLDDTNLGRDKEYAATLSERYHEGGTYEVRYNPKNPSDAVLEPGTDPWPRIDYYYLFGGIVVSVGSAIFIWWGLKYPRAASRPGEQNA